MLLACGLVAIMSSNLLGQLTNLSTNQFIQLWSETFLILVFGAFLMAAALFVDSKSSLWENVAGALGMLSAAFGAIDSLTLQNLTTGIYSGVIRSGSQTAQLAMSVGFLTVAVLVVVFVAFPLGLVGAMKLFHGETA